MSETIGGQTVPDNTNFLHENKFKLIFRRIPNITYFCTEANIPGVAINTQAISNLVNRITVGGTKLNYDDFQVTFKVDEDLTNYKELRAWIEGIGAPINTNQFAALIATNENIRHEEPGYNIWCDATLASLTNVNQFNASLTFRDLFPVSLSSISFKDGIAEHVTATATFKYLNFSFTNQGW